MTVSRTALLLALFSLLLAVGGRAEPPAKGPFSDVPREHWAYDNVQTLVQLGIFTGYPDGTFTGRRSLTRYEFAVALQRMLTEVQRELVPLERTELRGLVLLVEEFAPELEMLGADVEQIRLNLKRYHPRPYRLSWDLGEADRYETTLNLGGRVQPTVRAEGARRAAEEWRRGEVVLYSWDAVEGPQVSRRLGIPYRRMAGETPKAAELELIAGHNAEVIRRVELYGPPRSACLRWMEWIDNPEAAWQAAAAPPGGENVPRRSHVTRLAAWAPETVSPDGKVLVRLEPGAKNTAARLHLSLPERRVAVAFTRLPDENREVALVWGPPASNLVLLRSPLAEGGFRINVLDLRSGRILNSVEREGP